MAIRAPDGANKHKYDVYDVLSNLETGDRSLFKTSFNRDSNLHSRMTLHTLVSVNSKLFRGSLKEQIPKDRY